MDAVEPMLSLSTSVALISLLITVFLAVVGWLCAKCAKLEKEIKQMSKEKASNSEVSTVKADLKELLTLFNAGINNIETRVDSLIMSLLNQKGG